jgi:hypothetical protein
MLMNGCPLVLVDVVDGADVGVIEGGGGPGLALEALPGLGIGEGPFWEELEGHPAVEAGVHGLVDHAHAPAADLPADPVVGDGLADHVSLLSKSVLRSGGSLQSFPSDHQADYPQASPVPVDPSAIIDSRKGGLWPS